MNSQHNIHVLLFTTLLLIMTLRAATSNGGVFDVTSYGAKGDAKDDDSAAFVSAWSAACSYSQGDSTMLIPEGSYLVGPLMFRGHCSAKVKVQLNGNLLASTNLDDYAPKNGSNNQKNWIEFKCIDGLNITGVGVLDGQGASAWPLNNCSQKHCTRLPTTLVLSYVRNANIYNVSSINSKFFHMSMLGCEEVTIDSVTITAPKDSPNTDGIHISNSTSVGVLNSAIGTGDDCISIGPGNTNVTITNVSCGPGHGISVGSLGARLYEKPVKGLTVTNCTFNQSDNGVRIKTWQSSASSSLASGFVFEDVTMINVKNPIIIDQKYCPYKLCNTTEPSKVKIKDVKFRNFSGTSSTEAAINLVCSDWFPCEEIELSNITLVYNGPKPHIKNTTATCVNARGTSSGTMNPKSCLVPESFHYLPYSPRDYLLKISSEDMMNSSVRTTRDAISSLFVSFISFNFSLLLLPIPEMHHRITIPYLLANLLVLANAY